MKFNETKMEGVYLITLDKYEDERGFFARTYDSKIFDIFFEERMSFIIKQTSISYNKKKGTLRGIHFQDIPYREEKMVQCVKGSIYDILIDLRQTSKTYNKWMSFNLSDKNNSILYIPKKVAHGFQTLEDDTIVLYYMNQEYHPECAKTIRYDDERYGLVWKLPITSISQKDLYSDSRNVDDEICNQNFG